MCKKGFLDMLHDLGLAAVAGAAAALGAAAVLGLLGFLFGGFTLASALNWARSGLLIIGALLLFLVAGLLVGHRASGKIQDMDQWKKVFRAVGPSAVFLAVAVMVLLAGGIVDRMMWHG